MKTTGGESIKMILKKNQVERAQVHSVSKHLLQDTWVCMFYNVR